LRAPPPVVAPEGDGTPALLGIVSLCRRDRRHGKPGGVLRGNCWDAQLDWAESISPESGFLDTVSRRELCAVRDKNCRLQEAGFEV